MPYYFILCIPAPLIMSSYRPDSDRAMEVRLYEGTNNPSPIIDLVEQEMAFRAQGVVHVYIEYEKDLSALKKVVKVSTRRLVWYL